MNCSAQRPFILVNEKYPHGLPRPCGSCLSCRINKASEWALRLVHEQAYYDKSCFITLTYDNEHLPKNYSVQKRHLTNFFKLLRYYSEKQNRKIKYFGVGEYGEDNYRPHYHAIIFGIDFTENKVNSDNLITEGIIKQAWSNGQIHIGTVTHESAQYVAGYMLKSQQIMGKKGILYYAETNREPPFKLSSQGIGLRFAQAEKDNIQKNNYIPFKKEKKPIPVYYRKKLDLDITEITEIAIKNSNKVLEYHMKNSNTENFHIVDLNEYNDKRKSKNAYKLHRDELFLMEEQLIQNQQLEDSKRRSRQQIENYLKEQSNRNKPRIAHEN